MKTPEEVAREILDAMWERVGNEGFDEDATTPDLIRIICARDAEVTLATFTLLNPEQGARD